jgi:anti-sigma B factor antagonist
MDDRRFGAQVVEVPDEVCLRMRGDLDSRADQILSSAYSEVAAFGSSRLTLDFNDVGYINSTGIALVVRLLADARRDGRGVRAVGLTSHYREIFRITRLSDFMDIVEGDAA